MIAYENDVLVIPEAIKKMTASEIKQEKERLLREIKSTESVKRVIKPNKNNIVFNM